MDLATNDLSRSMVFGLAAATRVLALPSLPLDLPIAGDFGDGGVAEHDDRVGHLADLVAAARAGDGDVEIAVRDAPHRLRHRRDGRVTRRRTITSTPPATPSAPSNPIAATIASNIAADRAWPISSAARS